LAKKNAALGRGETEGEVEAGGGIWWGDGLGRGRTGPLTPALSPIGMEERVPVAMRVVTLMRYHSSPRCHASVTEPPLSQAKEGEADGAGILRFVVGFAVGSE